MYKVYTITATTQSQIQGHLNALPVTTVVIAVQYLGGIDWCITIKETHD